MSQFYLEETKGKFPYAILHIGTITRDRWLEINEKIKTFDINSLSKWDYSNEDCALSGSHLEIFYFDKKAQRLSNIG